MPRRIFISVAEDSADIHAASLVRTAASEMPDATFHGLTGPRLRALGVETVFDFSAHAAMLTGVFRVVGRAWRAMRAAVDSWRRQRPDLVVLIDSPELHLPLAKRARSMGLKVLYYVAPQTWASRAYRNRRIARDVDRLACILPFEESYFRDAGVNATFVGHPLFEALAREAPSAAAVEALRGRGRPLVALLPGSRAHVIDAVLPLQLRVLKQLARAGVGFRAAVSAVDESRAARIRAVCGRSGVAAEVVVDDNASLLTAADLILVASGTATLHVAHYRKPMIVMYDAGWLLSTLHGPLGRFFLTIPHLSLVNILGGRRIVPEFMPAVRDVGVVARTTANLLADESWRRRIVADIEEIAAPLEGGSASRNVCAMMRELMP